MSLLELLLSKTLSGQFRPPTARPPFLPDAGDAAFPADILEPILNSLADGILVTNKQGKIILYNDEAAGLLGLCKNSSLISGWPAHCEIFLLDTVTPVSTALCPLSRALEGETSDRLEIFIRSVPHPEGFFAEVIARPLKDGEADVYGAAASFRNVTSHKRVEANLRVSNARFQALAHMMNDVVWEWDLSTDQVWRQPGTRGAFGYPEAKVRADQMWWQDGIHPEDFAKISSDLERLKDGKLKVWREEYRFRRPDGTYAYVLDQGHPIRFGAEGRPDRILGAMVDITDRKGHENQLKKMASELARSNKELEQFAFVASHDLREPLRMVSSYLKLTLQRGAERLTPEGHEFLGYALDGANRMRLLIDNLLDYCRTDHAGTAFESVDCQKTLEQVRTDLGMALRESGGVLECGKLPSVLGHPVQVAQLFRNLISNALKFRTDAPPRVSVDCKQHHEMWLFRVSDDGIGLDPKESTRVFEIFERAHADSHYPGVGIGLAVCKKIVERHGGKVWIESVIGKGTDFYFTLPAMPPTSEPLA